MKNLIPTNNAADDSRPQDNPPGSPFPQELVAEGYKTNDPVDLSGGLGRRTLKRVRVSGAPPIYLDQRQFLVLFILACHRLTQKGLPAPFPVPGAPFLSAAAILEAIDRFQECSGASLSVLANGIDADIARVVFGLREKLRKNGLNPNLIETGPRGTGYRLSTPPANVTVTLLRPHQPSGDPREVRGSWLGLTNALPRQRAR